LAASTDLGQNVGRLDDDHFVIAHLIRRSAVLTVDDLIASLDLQWAPRGLLDSAGSDGEDLEGMDLELAAPR
jgi:hypothetical protein